MGEASGPSRSTVVPTQALEQIREGVNPGAQLGVAGTAQLPATLPDALPPAVSPGASANHPHGSALQGFSQADALAPTDPGVFEPPAPMPWNRPFATQPGEPPLFDESLPAFPAPGMTSPGGPPPPGVWGAPALPGYGAPIYGAGAVPGYGAPHPMSSAGAPGYPPGQMQGGYMPGGNMPGMAPAFIPQVMHAPAARSGGSSGMLIGGLVVALCLLGGGAVFAWFYGAEAESSAPTALDLNEAPATEVTAEATSPSPDVLTGSAPEEIPEEISPVATAAPRVTATSRPTATVAPTTTVAPTATVAPTTTTAPTGTTAPTTAPTTTTAPTATTAPTSTGRPRLTLPTATTQPTSQPNPQPTSSSRGGGRLRLPGR